MSEPRAGDKSTPVGRPEGVAELRRLAGRVCPDCNVRELVYISWAAASGCPDCLLRERDRAEAERDEYARQCREALAAQAGAERERDVWFAAKVNAEAERNQLKAALERSEAECERLRKLLEKGETDAKR